MAVAGHLEQPTRGFVGVGHTSPPIWPCSDWGLPCRRCCQRRGGLLPHRFTLAGASTGGLFSVALSRGSPRVGVTDHPALWSPDFPRQLAAAAPAGDPGRLRQGDPVLVFGYHDTLMNRARLKLPEPDVADVVSETLASAIASAFDGSSVGEFKSWLHTILSRRIADYHDARTRTPRTAPLPGEHLGDDEVWGEEPSEPFDQLPQASLAALVVRARGADRHAEQMRRFLNR